MSMMGGSAQVPGRANPRLQLRQPASIAVYDSYDDAQHAVDYLADHHFPVQFLSIVGTELKSIERITGGLSWGRVLTGAAMNGFVWGAMAAVLFYFFVPNVSVALVFLGTVVVFVLANVLTSGISYALSHGRRDFTSSSQIIATRYEVIGENEVAGQARRLLSGGRSVPTFRPPEPAETVGQQGSGPRPAPGWGAQPARPQDEPLDFPPPAVPAPVSSGPAGAEGTQGSPGAGLPGTGLPEAGEAGGAGPADGTGPGSSGTFDPTDRGPSAG